MNEENAILLQQNAIQLEKEIGYSRMVGQGKLENTLTTRSQSQEAMYFMIQLFLNI